MAECRACGAAIEWVEVGGQTFSLDMHETVGVGGERRWSVDEDGVARRIPNPSVPARADHRTTCPLNQPEPR